MVSLECGQAAKEIGVRNVLIIIINAFIAHEIKIHIQCYRIKRLKVQLNYNRIKRLKNAKN